MKFPLMRGRWFLKQRRTGKMATRTELKPCPFCGAAAEIENYVDDGRDEWWVFCGNTDCPVTSQTIGIEREDAVMNWNKRASTPRDEFAEILRGLKLRGVITGADIERLEQSVEARHGG